MGGATAEQPGPVIAAARGGRLEGGMAAAAERNTRWSSRNPFLPLLPAGTPVAAGAALEPRGAAQTPGPECWKCGWPGHLRRECLLMEVRQVFLVTGTPAPAPVQEGHTTYR